GELSRGRQAIAAVVSGPTHDQKAAGGGGQLERLGRQRGAGVLHQQRSGHPQAFRHALQLAHLLRGDDRFHRGRSSTTAAAATPPSWVKARKTSTPRRSTSARARPIKLKRGAPPSRTTSISVHRNPGGAPRAFTSASLAANRAAYAAAAPSARCEH